MSTPDARLNAAERAALADLEAAATAADPHLAARLRGRVVWRPGPAFGAVAARIQTAWITLLAARSLGPPLILVGLLLTVLGIGSGIGLSLVGALMATLGLRLVAEMISARSDRHAGGGGT